MRRRLLALLTTLATAHAAACATAASPPRTTATARPQAPTPALAPPAADAADREARLAHLAGVLEQERERQHVPGMAVAVVRGDRIIFARGFGVRDLTTGEAVTPETLFAIGSSTKAFTSTAVGMMVDEGKLSWDDPLSRHVPSLDLQVKSPAGEHATVRDALSHRTGFPRMSVLWASGALSRDEVFQHASRAQPTAEQADLGKAGRMVQVVNGDSAWVDSSFDQAEQLDGLRMAQARIQHPLAFMADWRQRFGEVEILGTETVDGKVLHVVSLRAGELPVWRAYVDPATGDVVEVTGFEIQPFGNVPSTSSFADYRQVRGVKGLRLPFQITAEVFQSGDIVVTFDRIRTGLRPDPALYPRELPAARHAVAPAAAPGGGK